MAAQCGPHTKKGDIENLGKVQKMATKLLPELKSDLYR